MNGVDLMARPILVIGAGAWGTALAILLARNGQPVWLWARDPHQISALSAARCNARCLPDIPFPPALQLTSDLSRVLAAAPDVLMAVSSVGFRAVLESVSVGCQSNAAIRLAWATKGFEPGSGQLLHQVVAEVLGDTLPTAIISGPTFAREVAEIGRAHV